MRTLVDGQVASDDGDGKAYIAFLEDQFARESLGLRQPLGGSAVQGLFEEQFRDVGAASVYEFGIEPPFQSR